MEPVSYKNLSVFALRITRQASLLLQRTQSKSRTAKQKDEVDLATTSDLASERLLRAAIIKKYPNHGVLSEESEPIDGSEGFTWVLDPLDGTKEYALGMSDYGCLVAVELNGNVVVGVADYRGLHEVYSAVMGEGSFLNGQTIHVSDLQLEKSMMSLHLPTKKSKVHVEKLGLGLIPRCIHSAYRLRAHHCDAYALGLVSRGILSAHIILPDVPEWWDVAPSLLLVTEAGGTITDLYGNPVRNRDLTKGILASNTVVHDKIMEIIAEVI